MTEKCNELREELLAMESVQEALLEELADLRAENEELQLDNEVMRERESLIRALIEQAPDAFFVHDLEGRFVFANQAACELLNYSREEILAMSVHDLEYGISPEQIKAYWEEVGAGKSVRTEGLLRHKDSSHLPADIRIGLFDAAEKTVIYGIARDISQRKKMEERLRQSHKMEAVGTLAGGIAHDFNNILGIILGCAELGGDPLDVHHPTIEYLKEIKSGVARAKDVVRQLLNFSQDSDETREPLRISPLVKASVKLMRSTTPANIDICTSIDDNCYKIMANPAQIHQVMINMCTNAVHATRRGGSIDIELKNRILMPADTDSDSFQFRRACLQLTIRDTGCGIAPELTERIFDPYFTTKDFGRGSGMGLAVVHGIVQRLGGVIHVTSQLDEGTTFDIYLPAAATQQQQHSAGAPDEGSLPVGIEHILVVDDETAIVNGLKERLEALGYSVEGYTSPEQALITVKHRPDRFDLMITDMAMPKMTGEILIRQVQQLRTDLPVILCTGFSEWVDEQAPEKIGAAKILLKPITREELACSVREVIDGAAPTQCDEMV
ncbi:MAG: ATP-binding protein [Desulfobacteraceae bacterium]